MRIDIRRGMTVEAKRVDKVLLNGVPVNGVLMADTIAGVVIAHPRDTFTGKLQMGEVRMNGKVTIVYRLEEDGG